MVEILSESKDQIVVELSNAYPLTTSSMTIEIDSNLFYERVRHFLKA